MPEIPQVDVPEGESGNWRVVRETLTKEDLFVHNLKSPRYIAPGTYTRLTCGRDCVMSDTPAEMRDHFEPVRRARGHVLLMGLGLGMVANAMLLKPEVTRATVIELSEHVISLVASHWKAKWRDRLEIIHADALTWAPPKGTRYGAVWHDIWTFICADNLEQMKTLHRRFGRRTDWQGSWCKEECRMAARGYRF